MTPNTNTTMTEISLTSHNVPTIIDQYNILIDNVFSATRVVEIREQFAQFPGNWVALTNRLEEQRIKHMAAKLRDELRLYFSDPYVRESYDYLAPEMVNEIIIGLERILLTKRERVLRKTRSVAKITKAFKFNANGDPDLKALPFLKDPQKIMGALAVLIWVPKRRMAVWLQAKDNSGLAIVKNNIVRFDEEESFAKTVRKPEELIAKLGESRKKMVQYLHSIKTQEYCVNGKMNKKYVIVKVW